MPAVGEVERAEVRLPRVGGGVARARALAEARLARPVIELELLGELGAVRGAQQLGDAAGDESDLSATDSRGDASEKEE